MKFRIKIDKERCKGCDLCISVCPNGTLKQSKELNSKGQHFVEIQCADDCTGCKQCTDICPDVAIEIESDDQSREAE
ncbi:4Fe-4S binding protein [Verrucomicrobiota bacterium]